MFRKYQIKNKKILEIGSNDGFLLKLFQKNNSILGVDSSQEMVKLTQKINTKSKNTLIQKLVIK